MKKLLHATSFIIIMACALLATSCDKDDPQTSEPITPTEPTDPTTPTESYTIKKVTFTFKAISGDTTEFKKFFVDSIKKLHVDLIENNNLSYTIGGSFLKADSIQEKGFDKQKQLIEDLIKSFSKSEKYKLNTPSYIGIVDYSTARGSSQEKDWKKVNISNSNISYPIITPNIANTKWTTNNDKAPFRAIEFKELLNSILKVSVQIDGSTYYAVREQEKNNEITIYKESDESRFCTLKLNASQQQLVLIDKDGSQIEDPDPVYTLETEE